MSTKTRCQAKDPSKCPYHGSIFSRLSPEKIVETRLAHLRSFADHPASKGADIDLSKIVGVYDTLYDATLSANTELELEINELQKDRRQVPQELYDRLLAVQTLKVIRTKSTAAVEESRNKIEAQDLLTRARKNDHLVHVLHQEINRLQEEYKEEKEKPSGMISSAVLSRAYGAAIFEIETFLQPLEKEQDNPTGPVKSVTNRLVELFK